MNCLTAVPMMFAALALTACIGSEDEKGTDGNGIYQLEMEREYDGVRHEGSKEATPPPA